MITTEIKDYVIITFSKEKHFITQKQFQFLSGCGNNKMVTIGEISLNTSNVATMMSLKEYYNQFPKERPASSDYMKIILPSIDYKKKYLSTEKRIEAALKTWRRQRDNQEVEIQSGGLAKLIKWAEGKLSTLQNANLQS